MPADLVVSFDLFTTNFPVVRKHSVVYRRNKKPHEENASEPIRSAKIRAVRRTAVASFLRVSI